MPMAATPPSNSKPSGDDRNIVPVDEKYAALTFEDRLHLFWKNNRMVVLGLCALVLVAILAKGFWEYHQRGQELAVESAYQAAITPEQLRAFASAHSEDPLAGVALMRVADEAYAAGKSADALTAYEKAMSVIKTGPLAVRAQLGHALAEAQAGKTSDAVSELRQILNDTNQFKAARAEAGYQLASLAADAGNVADVQKYVDQLSQVDPSSPWTQRAMMLRATLATPAPAATSSAAPANSSSGPNVQIKLPSK